MFRCRWSAHYCRAVVHEVRQAARYHGDQAVTSGMLDFAVNVRSAGPPSWLVERLGERLTELGHYPSAADVTRATEAVAARHGRGAGEVALLAGGAEGFALLPNLEPRLAALIAPSFTEPEAVLSAAGVPIQHVVLDPPFTLAGAAVPAQADLVVVGNPTNPTSVLHPRVTFSRCVHPAGSSSSTRPSPTRCPASRNRWPRCRCPMWWCCAA